MDNKKSIEDLTIVIQGRCEVEQIKHWIENYKDINIVLSIWEDANLDLEFPSNWIVIKSNYKDRYATYCRNIDLQIESTLIGLEFVKTKYVIKVRADEYWSNMNLVYEKIKSDENKVLCGSMFFRPIDLYAFHISDHIIGGTTDNIKFMFESTKDGLLKEIWKYIVPECMFGFYYVGYKEGFDFSNLGYYLDRTCADYLRKHFHIIDVNLLSPFICTETDPNPSNPTGRNWYIDSFSNGNCITQL
jgi:hypothetical protein